MGGKARGRHTAYGGGFRRRISSGGNFGRSLACHVLLFARVVRATPMRPIGRRRRRRAGKQEQDRRDGAWARVRSTLLLDAMWDEPCAPLLLRTTTFIIERFPTSNGLEKNGYKMKRRRVNDWNAGRIKMEGKKISRSLCAPESSEGKKEGERWLFYFSATRENLF